MSFWYPQQCNISLTSTLRPQIPTVGTGRIQICEGSPSKQKACLSRPITAPSMNYCIFPAWDDTSCQNSPAPQKSLICLPSAWIAILLTQAAACQAQEQGEHGDKRMATEGNDRDNRNKLCLPIIQEEFHLCYTDLLPCVGWLRPCELSPFHTGMSVSVISIQFTWGSHVAETSWLWFLTFLGDKILQYISYSSGFYNLSNPSSGNDPQTLGAGVVNVSIH